MRGQALILTAIVLAVAIMVIAVLFRMFTMTPAFVYQRSIYYSFKYSPQVIAQQVSQVIQETVLTYARNYSDFLEKQGILLYLHALTQVPTQYSLANLLATQLRITVESIYTPIGLLVPVTPINPIISASTGFYGALNVPGIKYIYANGQGSSIAIKVNQTYDMPTLGIQHLTIGQDLNLTATTVKPGPNTCNGNLNIATYQAITTCTFNFNTESNPFTYTCTGPGTYSTGDTKKLWAYNSAYGENMYVFIIPLDEVDANAGFSISAIFEPKGSNAQANVIVLSSSPNPNVNLLQITEPTTITVVVKPSASPYKIINNNPGANIEYFVNNENIGTYNYVLPGFNLVTNTIFGNNAYIFSGSGSWAYLVYQNAKVVSVTIKLFNNYTVSRNTYVAVSYNGHPAVGASLNGISVTPLIGVTDIPLEYSICNITDNAAIFNVSMPWPPKGYPNTQYLLTINYSGIKLMLNPWSPSNLFKMGINPTPIIIPNNDSSTSLVTYNAYILNETSGSLIDVNYFANIGIPTLYTVYNDNYTTQVNEYQTIYAIEGPIIPFPWMNIFNEINNNYPLDKISIFTFNEILINLGTGYTAIAQVIPPRQTQITGFGNTNNYPTGLYNWITERQYFPNQTLPYTYFYYTLLNCETNNYYNSFLYFIYNSMWNSPLRYIGTTNPYYLPSCQRGW
ncbi:MAG: hypothetical protein RXO28_07210 [Thermocladium sp.]